MSEMNNNAPIRMEGSNTFEVNDPYADIDLDVWYQAERTEVEDIVRDAMDLSVWSLEGKKEQTSVYLHCKNNETQSYAVRAVTRITGSVHSVIECLRAPDSASHRAFNKLLYSRIFLDSEVLYTNMDGDESLTLKWLAFSNGKNSLGRGKEFCIREYCSIVRDHPILGTFGICKFESYDGVGARYTVRGKPDSFSKTIFEPSSLVVYEAEDGMVVVTLTFGMRKARGSGISSGVKALSMRLAYDMSNLQQAVQHTRFLPTSLADKREWVNDRERSNCSLCVHTFSMLKRRHHCRVCGEVVCSSCTVFKSTNAHLEGIHGKIRVCKACLGKGSNEPPKNVETIPLSPIKNNQLNHQSTISSSPTSSDESRRSTEDPSRNLFFKHSSSSFSDCDPILKQSSLFTSTHRTKSSESRTHYFNQDFHEICMLAMETLDCTMAGIRTDDFELVVSYDGQFHPELPRSLPTFRRIASRGKPCIVLNVALDKRISEEKRMSAKLQFFIGIPLMIEGEVVGDLCVADVHAREGIDPQAVDVLMVLGKTITQYMMSGDYIDDLADFKRLRIQKEQIGIKEVAF